jgi:hypothetical protein
MRTKHKFSFKLALILVLFLANACTDDFADINTNPNLVTDEIIKPDLLLTKILKESIFSMQSTISLGEFSGYASNPSSGDILTNSDKSSPFSDYTSHVVNLAAIIRLTNDDPAFSNKNAIARIWKVWVFHRMTDSYGDIPYFETAKAVDEVIVAPKYNTQQDIYIDMLKELKEAAAQLSNDNTKTSYGSADVFLGSNADAWKRFANSLRLRLAMRVRYADATLAQTHISEVIDAELIATNAQNAFMKSEGESAVNTNNWNPIYNYERAKNFNRSHPSITVSENLLKTNDPRLPIYIEPSLNAGYRSRPISLAGQERIRYSGDSISFLGPLFRQAEYTFNVITSAEVSFLKSEAVLAGLASGNANDLYRQGIRLSMEQYGVDAAAIDTFMATSAATLAGSDEEKLEQIIVQKYLATYMDAYEAFAEYRRTGYPKMWIGSGPTDTNRTIPRRLTYPQSEYDLNEANVREAAGRLALGDVLVARIWWDAKAGLPYTHPRQDIFPPEIE